MSTIHGSQIEVSSITSLSGDDESEQRCTPNGAPQRCQAIRLPQRGRRRQTNRQPAPPSIMKSCAYCGRDNEDEATHCRECGTTEFVIATASAQPAKPSVEFIRMFFKSPTEEQFAVECAEFIRNVVGDRVLRLLPDTRWSEILQWFGPKPAHGALFAMLLKKRFGKDVNEIIAASEFMTFREFVEYVCKHHQNAA